MEETLTNCLIKMREEFNKLQHIRECLDSNANSQSQSEYSVTWRIIEAFNTSLVSLKDNDEHQSEILNAILDGFHYVSCNSNEESVWKNFGSELGDISLKFLSLIEKTDQFENFFCKLLSTINQICEHTSDLWKVAGRQILNVFINKKLSLTSLEMALKHYVSILMKTDDFVMRTFTQQNFHLVKTFSKTLLGAGDIEIQMKLMEAMFLHVSKNAKKMEELIYCLEPQIKFSYSHSRNFEDDCRTYLNKLNQSIKGVKNVFSVNCKKIVFGGCNLEPPYGKRTFWLDANKSTKRLSTKCLNWQKGPPHEVFIYIQFEDVAFIQIELQPENLYNIVFRVRNLNDILPSVTNDEVICTAKPTQPSQDNILEFKEFLEKNICGINYKNEKLSESCDQIVVKKSNFLLKSSLETSNPSAQTDLKKEGIDRIIPHALSLLTKIEREGDIQHDEAKQNNDANEKIRKNNTKPTELNFMEEEINEKRDTTRELKDDELSPQSFVESLNKHLGLDSPSILGSYDLNSSLLSLKLPKHSPKKISHKLFHEPYTVFDFIDDDVQPIDANLTSGPNTKGKEESSGSGKSKEEKTLEASKKLEFSDTQSDNYFVDKSKKRRKPTMPKMKPKGKKPKKRKILHEKKTDFKIEDTTEVYTETTQRPSLLDPNGYAYKRWQEPTTSERSKFWLKKLDGLDGEKRKSFRSVFEFIDDSDTEYYSISRTNKKKKIRNTKPKLKTIKLNPKGKKAVKRQEESKKNKMEKTVSIGKNVTNFPTNMNETVVETVPVKYKNKTVITNSQKEDENAIIPKNTPSPPSDEFPTQQVGHQVKINDPLNNDVQPAKNQMLVDQIMTSHSYSNLIIQRRSSVESVFNESDKEYSKEFPQRAVTDKNPTEKTMENIKRKEAQSYVFDNGESSQIGGDLIGRKKREYTDENHSLVDNNLTKRYKRKTVGSTQPRPLPPPSTESINQLKKSQIKFKQETDEIIQTFAHTTRRFLNRIHKKNVNDMITYVKRAEKACLSLDFTDIMTDMDKIERFWTYYKTTCSESGWYESAIEQMMAMKNAMEKWDAKKTEISKKFEKVNGRLERLMVEQINDKSRLEVRHFKVQVMNYISLCNGEWIT